MVIKASKSHLEETESQLTKGEALANQWLKANSLFFKQEEKMDFSRKKGYPSLYQDLQNYVKHFKVEELEHKTAEQYVLNPYSGEWLKGMRMVMAEMGLIDFEESIPRTANIFEGIGSKDNRKKYIIYRMAFLRRIFKEKKISQVPLYRGMSSEVNLVETPKTLLSTTFHLDTALSFSGFQQDNAAIKSSYCFKWQHPIKNLFMTYFETEAFNGRYQEQEGIIFYNQKISI